MPRFVVLRHEMPTSARAGVHWDLMLEHLGRLRTWALAKEPAIGVEIAAEALGDHRLAYLQYEGPVSGNRGTVCRWDEGEYEPLHETAEEIALVFNGQRLLGNAMLKRDYGNAQRWMFQWLRE